MNFYLGRKRRQIDYQDEEPEYEDENFDYMTEENEDLLDLVLDDSNNVSMIATQKLGFEGKADDDINARKEFSKIVNHDFQFYKQKIRDINLNEMYEEFLESKLSDMLIGESDFLSDFVTPEVEMAGPGEDRNYGTNQKAEKARAQCETQLTRLWIKPELEFCGKLGSYYTNIAYQSFSWPESREYFII